MDPRKYKYSQPSRARDVLIAILLAFVPALLLFDARGLEGTGRFLSVWAVMAAVLTIPFMACRWSSFIRIDTRGVTRFRQRGRPVCHLEWSEIEELAFTSLSCGVVRGSGRSIRITSEFVGSQEALTAVTHQVSPVIHLRLGTRLREGETVRFGARTPKAYTLYP